MAYFEALTHNLSGGTEENLSPKISSAGDSRNRNLWDTKQEL